MSIILLREGYALLKYFSFQSGVTSNGHSGERRCGSSHMSGKEARWQQSFAVGVHAGEVRWRQSFTVGGHRERSGREEQGVAVNGGKRRGGMKQNNYQPVR